ncbi:MAG: HXXEE domain-containing protein [Xanthobacteraceae bacterium]
MSILSRFAANWQRFLPALSAIGIAAWIALFRNDPTSERALFAALLVIYFIHQIEEHLWPGGFRQFADAHMFHSGNDNWPVNIDGVALVNTAFVWLPIALAAFFPQTLRWVGLAWVGLTLINGIIHIVTTIRLRIYNPGLVTSIVLFLPFTIYVLVLEVERGALSGADVGLIALYGVLLHLPVAALFAVPFLLRRRHLASS